MNSNNVEIMAPAGSYETLMTAINAGAQSIYFGVGNLNMRSRSANFQEEDLEKVAEICHEHHVRSYLTVNTVVFDEELGAAKELCKKAKDAGITAIIASDMGVIQYCQEIDMEVHLSTQCNVTNLDAVKYYSAFADVIVLARELNLQQIKYICEQIKEQNIRGPKGNLVQIEVFIHGALCIAFSGKCYMSLAQYNHSANRGACLQTCRRSYKIIDDETGDELKVDNKYIMSPSDLSTLEILDKILKTGVSVLKIEGRGRGAEYVDCVVKVYKEAIDAIQTASFTKENVDAWKKRLSSVFNRGFWEGGYYLGEKIGEWSGVYGSKATERKKTIGVIKNYYDNIKVVECEIQTGTLKVGDEVMITGPTTGIIRTTLHEMRVNEDESKVASKGDVITFPVELKARKNDQVFLVEKVEE